MMHSAKTARQTSPGLASPRVALIQSEGGSRNTMGISTSIAHLPPAVAPPHKLLLRLAEVPVSAPASSSATVRKVFCSYTTRPQVQAAQAASAPGRLPSARGQTAQPAWHSPALVQPGRNVSPVSTGTDPAGAFSPPAPCPSSAAGAEKMRPRNRCGLATRAVGGPLLGPPGRRQPLQRGGSSSMSRIRRGAEAREAARRGASAGRSRCRGAGVTAPTGTASAVRKPSRPRSWTPSWTSPVERRTTSPCARTGCGAGEAATSGSARSPCGSKCRGPETAAAGPAGR
mmetsp:Transcript_83908/g.264919  ORF Transcript_83908/g.264919 Transcript_83908/m.264919 type:complete len:286 (+) Transcript_83908:118-975(+)